MPKYLLSVHMPADAPPRPPMSEEDMQLHMKRLGELEGDMHAQGAWTFSARLTSPDAATVVRKEGEEFVTSDGPFVEAKEHMGGFYIIEAADLDEALSWAKRTVDTIGMPIEVWPFADFKA